MRTGIGRLIVDLVAELFEADGRLLRTLPRFLLQPGVLVQSFVNGRRARYTSPVRILVFALATGFLCMGMGADRTLDRTAAALQDRPVVIENGALEINGENQLNLTVQAAEGSSFETNLKHLEGMNQRQAARLLVNGWLDAAPTVVFLLIPAFTLVLEVFYPKFLVIEHLVLSTLLHAQALILMGFAAVIGSPIGFGVAALWIYGQLLYMQWQVYQQPPRTTLAKWFGACVGHVLLLLGGFLAATLLMLANL